MIERLYKKYKYILDFFFIVFLAGCNSVVTYVASIYTNRNLSVEHFAEYNAIMSIYSVIILTISTYSYYIMQNYHSVDEEKKLSYQAYTIVIAFIVSIVYILSAPLMPIFFNIRQINIYLIVSIPLFFNILYAIRQSIAKANGLIKTDYIINIASNFFGRFLLLGFFIYTGFTIFKASITIASYTILSFILISFTLDKFSILHKVKLKDITKYINKNETKNILKTIAPILIFNAIFNLLLVFDVLMAIRFLDKEHAGYYATISIITKIFLYISTNIGSIMYSLLISATKNKTNNTNPKKQRRVIALSFIFNLIVISIFSIILYLFGDKIILLQFTEKYRIIISLIPEIIIFGFSISIIAILFNYLLFYKCYKPFYFYLPLMFFTYLALRNNIRTFSIFMQTVKIFFIVLLIYNVLVFIYCFFKNRK